MYVQVQIHSPPSINGRVWMQEKLLSNDAHNIFYQKRQCTHMYKHIPFLPHMVMGLCVGKYTLPIVWEDGLCYFTKKGNSRWSMMQQVSLTWSTMSWHWFIIFYRWSNRWSPAMHGSPDPWSLVVQPKAFHMDDSGSCESPIMLLDMACYIIHHTYMV